MNQSRRSFLNHSLAVAGMGAASGFALNLATMASAAAQSAPADYRALVCLFLYGGNDHYSTFVPFDTTSYNSYMNIRNVAPAPIFIDQGKLLQLNTATPGNGRQLSMAPSMTNLKSMYDQGQLAVMSNVGPLLAPMTKPQYTSGSVKAPPKLFSHNDQQSTWQTFSPEGSTVGWAGRMGDLLMSSNSNPSLTCINATGTAPLLTGNRALQYRISTSGAVAMSGANSSPFGASPDAFKSIIANNRGLNYLESDYVDVNNRSTSLQQTVSSGLANSPAFTLPTDLTNNSLAKQFQITARMIASNSTFGAKRQVFLISMGGFDTHDNENTIHPNLWGSIDKSVAYFYAALTQAGLQNNVTTFSASDFGRTLTSNGDGTDHAWGAHHFVAGGAVKGGDIYGTLPEVGLNTVDDVGQGRLIPTMSVEQYAYPMARWMGLSDTQVKEIFPNMGRFQTPTSFMRSA